MRGATSQRPSGLPNRGRLARQITALAGVIVIVLGCGGTPSTPLPSTTPLPSAIGSPPAWPTSVPSTQPTSGPGASPAASPQPSAGAWTAVKPTDFAQAALLTPTQTGGDAVARTSAFLLTSLDAARPAGVLASHVVATPAVQFTITESIAGAVLRPTEPLVGDTRYRFSLLRADGTVEQAWNARTAAPLAVVETIPADMATNVTLDAGIEIDLNQSGVTAGAAEQSISVSPKTPGHVVVSGRAIAFVPESQLRPATVYTVTVRQGLTAAATGEVLAATTVFRFETAGEAPSSVRLWFEGRLTDASPRERAALSVLCETDEGVDPPETTDLTVHRLDGLDAAMSGWRAIGAAPTWTVASGLEPIPTAALPKVLSATVAIRTTPEGISWVQLPSALPVGWYVVTLSNHGVPRQTILQVTDAATYALVTTTSTAVWVNDLATRAPAVGASATLDGTPVGAVSDSRGLIQGPTPARIASGSVREPLLLVRYRDLVTFRPVIGEGLCEGCDGKDELPAEMAVSRWWTSLATDRSEYRQSDTVNVVGIVRPRGAGSIPSTVRLTLVASDGSLDAAVPILTETAIPDARGMYTATLKLSSLPNGGYRVRAAVGDDKVGETWIDVGTILKPAYAISLATDRHAVIAGHPVRTSVGAAFFEGTPVAGARIGLHLNDPTGTVLATTTTSTTGQSTPVVRFSHRQDDQFTVQTIVARPTLPEEGAVQAAAEVAVFQGDGYITLGGSATKGTVTVTGALNAVAWSRYEAPGAEPWSVDPRGAPRPNARLRLTPIASYTVVKRVGSEYDFITKRVVPHYEETWHTFKLPTQTVVTAADGTFRLTFPTTHAARSYEVRATYVDASGHVIRTTGYISAETGPMAGEWFEIHGVAEPAAGYAVGATVRVQATGGGTPVGTPRYFFATLQQGLRGVSVGTSSTFTTSFTKEAVPAIEIVGVRFNGAGYDHSPYAFVAHLDQATRRLSIDISTDKPRYQPGETARVTIRVSDPSGRPTAASVFVQAVDQKLFAMGLAHDGDPLDALYAALPNGIVGTARSHRPPGVEMGGGKGDTGGGGPGGYDNSRTDFRDWLIAQRVSTDAAGMATVIVPLSDDLTSWRVAATAVDAALNAGAASRAVPVGLPFFVDAVLAPEFLASDRPVLRLRSFGAKLPAGTPVTFTVASDTLPMAVTRVTADAFGSAYVPLPALSAGTQRLQISASATIAGERLTDSLTRTFRVVASRATQLNTTWLQPDSTIPVRVGSGMTSLTLADAGRGRVVPILQELAAIEPVRSDQELAAAVASRVLADAFGVERIWPTNPDGLKPYSYTGGLAIVPWGSMDLEATALAAMADDPRLSRDNLSIALADAAENGDERLTRQLLILAGRAALGEPVDDLIAAGASRTDLTVEQKVNLALAALEAGDESLAAKLERAIVAANAQQSGDQIRLDPALTDDATVATARLAIVAASLGDPLAAGMDAYVAAHPSPSTLVVLERALAARGWAERMPSSAASAAITVDGVRKVVSLDAGQSVAYQLTPAQAASASITPVSGRVLVVQTADVPLAASSLKSAPGVHITRTVKPTGTIGAASTVIVTYRVQLPAADVGAGWRLVDSVPSGLVPVEFFGGPNENGDFAPADSPVLIEGQRVEFVTGWDPLRTTYTMRYVARVVSPGTYRWEPAVLQSTVDPARGVIVAPTTVTIATPGR